MKELVSNLNLRPIAAAAETLFLSSMLNPKGLQFSLFANKTVKILLMLMRMNNAINRLFQRISRISSIFSIFLPRNVRTDVHPKTLVSSHLVSTSITKNKNNIPAISF